MSHVWVVSKVGKRKKLAVLKWSKFWINISMFSINRKVLTLIVKRIIYFSMKCLLLWLLVGLVVSLAATSECEVEGVEIEFLFLLL